MLTWLGVGARCQLKLYNDHAITRSIVVLTWLGVGARCQLKLYNDYDITRSIVVLTWLGAGARMSVKVVYWSCYYQEYRFVDMVGRGCSYVS